MPNGEIRRTRGNGDSAVSERSLRLHLSLLLGTPVTDAAGHTLGRLRDLAMTPGEHALVAEFIFGRASRLESAPPDAIDHSLAGKLRLRDSVSPRAFVMSDSSLLLGRDLLDQQIIDIHGRKVVRVNDVTLVWSRNGEGGSIRVAEVEIGSRSALRRLLKGLASKQAIERIVSRVKPNAIPWDFVDLLEADPARRVRLKISHKRLARFHPSDLADILEDLAPAERESVFSTLDEEVAADALEEIEPKLQRRLVESLGSQRAADIMEEMDPGAAADLLGELPKDQSDAILGEMRAEERQEVEDLLEFSEHSAAGRMTTNYIAVPADAAVGKAIEELRNFDDDPETVTTIYLIDDQGMLAGAVPLARLLLSSTGSRLSDLSDSHVVSCPVTMHDKQVAEVFDRYNLFSLPVVDEQNVLVGVINADHVIAFMREQA
jgi:CBS domain-containing protein/sporulation protein YlmC with PRC-barrel domain